MKVKSIMVLLKKLIRLRLTSNDDEERMQSIDLIKAYEYGTNKDLVIEKEEIKCKNIVNWYKKWLTLVIKQFLINKRENTGLKQF